MMREVADNVTGLRVPRTGHWIAEENAADLAQGVLDFINSSPD
jgi:pimeloyl-ACP methyl ester carboxylesterase